MPALTEPELAAVRVALGRAGVRLDTLPESYRSAWKRSAVSEAVATDVVPVQVVARYARSPRSTRGATRA